MSDAKAERELVEVPLTRRHAYLLSEWSGAVLVSAQPALSADVASWCADTLGSVEVVARKEGVFLRAAPGDALAFMLRWTAVA